MREQKRRRSAIWNKKARAGPKPARQDPGIPLKIEDMDAVLADPRRLKEYTGLETEEFDRLLEKFAATAKRMGLDSEFLDGGSDAPRLRT